MPTIAENLISAARGGMCWAAQSARAGLGARCNERQARPLQRYLTRNGAATLIQEQHMSEQMISQAMIRANVGRGEELARQLERLVVQARRDQGCLSYELVQQNADCWALRGLWSNAETLQAHLQQPHLQIFQQLISAGLVRQMALSSHGAEQVPDASA